MYIDTHAHLWFEEYKDDLDEVIKRANENGVAKFVVPGTDLESSHKAIELAKKYPGVVYPAVGVHPEEMVEGDKVRPSPPMSMAGWALPSRSDLEGAVAIGEIGTDASTAELRGCMDGQKELFKTQCELALEHDLPIIVHTRESLNEALEVLDSLPKIPRGQFHCFSHDEEGLKAVLMRGFSVSFCGNISWSKRVARLVGIVPDDKLLLETDSPLMVPRDKKGQPIAREDRNEPANVVYLAQLIATLRGQSMEKIAEITTENAIRLFHL